MTDEAIIKITAGKGGNGCISFRREKYVPKGGPDGGDGGNGGSIYFVCDKNIHTLSEYARKENWHAQNGEDGRSKKQHGKNGEDLLLPVPPGTVISRFDKGQVVVLYDFVKADDKLLVAKGGRGGWGNVHFASATSQTPFIANKGKLGQEQKIKVELKLIADIGLIGLPNCGKSTFLSRISNARPKIANYPFTTLEPNLGVAKIQKKEYVFADIPGLIEGASAGKGLGDKFLRHIERTKTLFHIIDINSQNLEKDYQVIRKELSRWSDSLLKKREYIVLNKADTLEDVKAQKIAKDFSKTIRKDIYVISAVTGTGIKNLLEKL